MVLSREAFMKAMEGGLEGCTEASIAVECESDEVMTKDDFEAATDFIADLLLQNHLVGLNDTGYELA